MGPELHADSAGISSTVILRRGFGSNFGTKGSGGSVLRQLGVFFAIALAFNSLYAFSVPKESAKYLGVTKGKVFDSGLVFVNGQYLEPPYIVERWGTGIRINRQMVTGEIVAWSDIVKTQDADKVQTSTSTTQSNSTSQSPTTANSQPQSAVANLESSLDDLFDDDVTETNKEDKKSKKKPKAKKPKVIKPTVTYSLTGDFTPNAQSKALVAKVNVMRQKIDERLRNGGFVFFGDDYSSVYGDATTSSSLLEKLPEMMHNKSSVAEFTSALRSAGFVFLNERVCADLYRNRIDYLKLQRRREVLKTNAELKKRFSTSGF